MLEYMEMRRKFIYIIIISLCIFSSNFAQEDEGDVEVEEEKLDQYSSWEFGVSFSIPEEWEIKKRPGYLVRIVKPITDLSFSVKARLLSEIIPLDDFVQRMEREMKMSEGFARYDLQDIIDDVDFWGQEFTVPSEGDWSNPYEILLYDDTPDEELIEELKEKIKEMEEEGEIEESEKIEIPQQTEITVLYDEVGDLKLRHLIVYCIKGNVGYAFKMTDRLSSFKSNITIFNKLLRDIDIRHVYGGQYGIDEMVDIDIENSGVISGKVLYNGITVPDASIYLYKDIKSYRSGKAYKEIKSNYYGEYWFIEVKPGSNFIIDAEFKSDGRNLKAYKPIDNVSVSQGKVTFVNIELIE